MHACTYISLVPRHEKSGPGYEASMYIYVAMLCYEDLGIPCTCKVCSYLANFKLHSVTSQHVRMR